MQLILLEPPYRDLLIEPAWNRSFSRICAYLVAICLSPCSVVHNFGELKPTKHKEIVGRDGIPVRLRAYWLVMHSYR